MNRQSDISGRIRQWLVNGGTHWWKTGSRLRKKKKMKSPSPMRNSHDFISKGETEQKHHTESWKAALTRGSGFYPVAPCKIENQGTESAPQNQGEHPPVSRPPAGGDSENTGTHQRGRTEIDPSTLLAKMSVNPQPRVLHIPVNDQDWLRKKARNLTGSRRPSSGLRYSRMCSTKTELPSDDWSWLTSWLTSPPPGVETFNSSLFAPPNSKLKLLSKISTCLIPIFFIFENVSRWNVHFWVSFTSDKNMAKSMVKYGC